MTLLRIVAPHFVAGVVTEDGRITIAAPILSYMIGWQGVRFANYCRKREWRWERLP